MFQDRFQAGEKLARLLRQYSQEDTIVLAIPRGGVETGYAIAKELSLPLDVIMTKKITSPLSPEFAIGAVSSNGGRYDYEKDQYYEEQVERLKIEIKQREHYYRKGKNPLQVEGKNVILVDDGLATGNTMKAAIEMLKKHHAKKIILAVPVSSKSAFDSLSKSVDDCIVLVVDPYFNAVGSYYKEFHQLNDYEVLRLLEKHQDTQ